MLACFRFVGKQLRFVFHRKTTKCLLPNYENSIWNLPVGYLSGWIWFWHSTSISHRYPGHTGPEGKQRRRNLAAVRRELKGATRSFPHEGKIIGWFDWSIPRFYHKLCFGNSTKLYFENYTGWCFSFPSLDVVFFSDDLLKQIYKF